MTPEAPVAIGAEALPAADAGGARARQMLAGTKSHLGKSFLKLAGYVLAAYLLLKLVPAFEEALHVIEGVAWQWALVAFVLETISEAGFALSWSAIVDPESMLGGDGHGKHTDTRLAWAQLGAGIVVPGGSFGGIGVGAWILHRFGVPTKVVAEREFNLSFLNTAVDAVVLVLFGLALAVGIFPGNHPLTLTLLPALIAAAGVGAALLIAGHFKAPRPGHTVKHPKVVAAMTTLSAAVEDTRRLLLGRGGSRAVVGALAYLGLDVLVLWSAFIAIHADPVPGIAIVVMGYIIGALGGSIPLPANIGTIGGITGVLILYGVAHNTAFAAVLLYQAIGLLVPVVGGAIAYLLLRSTLRAQKPVGVS